MSALAFFAASATGCGGSAPPPAPSPRGLATAPPNASPSAASKAPRPFGPMVTPSLLLPDLLGDRGVVASEEGYRRVLRDRMRLIVREDGSIQRAAELIGTSDQPISSLELPSRLGGGFLFYVSSGTAQHGAGTQIYRASSWLGTLQPLVQLSVFVGEVVPGFDRLYLRIDVSNKLVAISPETGRELPLGPLPPASAYGPLAFADGWRAVVDADLRGPLATFDAGATWRPVAIPERVAGAAVLRGDPVLVTPSSAQYAVDARGVVTLRSEAPGDAPTELEAPLHAHGPMGRRPLRTAIEDGWPEGNETAVVARAGALGRVSLRDGSVVALTPDAYPQTLATCHAVSLERGFGFVCGEREGATTIYAFAPPLAMQRVFRSARPRFVASSGNGALVIRGACADDARDAAGSRSYCVRGVDGRLREIRVKGDLGAERVVALADGRIVVLAPPRPGAAGQLTLIKGAETSTLPLAIPADPKATAREVKRGMWLEGFEEREPGVLGGWVESGGPLVGVRVALDGKVSMGEPRDSVGDRVVMAGRFALAQLPEGRGAETVDGGMSWAFFDMPTLPEEDGAPATRVCGPVGCALERWLRIGWGKPRSEADFSPADAPAPLFSQTKISPTLTWLCDAAFASGAPPADKPTHAAGHPPPPSRGGRPSPTANGWLPFRSAAPPPLGKDELGLDNGNSSDLSPIRAYAWGKKGADWSRSGRWMIRFDDRFDPSAGPRASLVTASPWPDEAAAGEALGTSMTGYSSAQWSSFPEPGGRSMLAASCRGAACSLYAVTDGQPILAVRDVNGRTNTLPRILASSAVRVGDTWLFASQVMSQRTSSYGAGGVDGVAIYRVDLGVARLVTTLPRPVQRPTSSPPRMPRLVRRAQSGGVGLLIEVAGEPGEPAGSWFVLPLDPDSGQVGEPIPLGRRDLAGASPGRCAPRQDGWLLDTEEVTAKTNAVILGGAAELRSIEYRLRVDPGFVCVDGIASTMDGPVSRPKGAPAPKSPALDPDAIPFAASERARGLEAIGRRWGFQCRPPQ